MTDSPERRSSNAMADNARQGTKRPAPSLLPPFEPLSSSPGLPRPVKRQRDEATSSASLRYPTPIPTSSTGILSSSPPRVGGGPRLISHQARPQSAVSERAPLSAVPSIELNANGETLLMGRSSNSSQYQLSANRLISRVHVKARYLAASAPLEPNRIEIVCNGWNGIKLHCQARTWELAKGDTFASETEGAEIMLDVQDARVRILWPRRERADSVANLSDSSWDESPTRRGGGSGLGILQSSPLRRNARIASPVSPSPANNRPALDADLDEALMPLPHGQDDSAEIEIYEDGEDGEPELPRHVDAGDSFATVAASGRGLDSFSSDLSELGQYDDEDDNDPDEENDPIVHSFGPFGANLSNRLASFTHGSPTPKRARHTSSAPSARHAQNITDGHEATAAAATVSGSNTPTRPTTPQPAAEPAAPAIPASVDEATVRNHVVNQLAFSRLSSTPLPAIFSNLPADERGGELTKEVLRRLIEETACVGIIPRQGKDAAGKPLESEYYYVPEMDTDEQRRVAVTDGLRKPSLRNCRKQHKQYYWKRPRTP